MPEHNKHRGIDPKKQSREVRCRDLRVIEAEANPPKNTKGKTRKKSK